jgi:hypothetical protein
MDLGAANRKLGQVGFVAEGSVIKSQGIEVRASVPKRDGQPATD